MRQTTNIQTLLGYLNMFPVVGYQICQDVCFDRLRNTSGKHWQNKVEKMRRMMLLVAAGKYFICLENFNIP